MYFLKGTGKQDFVFDFSIENWQLHPDLLGFSRELFRGEYQDPLPVVTLKYHVGRYLRDLISGGIPCVKLVSEKFKKTVEENGLTGLKFYEVSLLGKDKKEIKGYYGISIVGRCQGLKPDVFEEGTMIFGPAKVEIVYRTNFEFDFENYDGSDFCVVNGKWWVFISERAKEILAKEKLSVSFVAVNEYIDKYF